MIVDNNPERNDETEKLIFRLFKKEVKISYYKNQKNIGMTGNWNRMCELAKGEWVVMLHDDDILFPDALRYINKVIQQEIAIDTVFLTTTKNREIISNTRKLQYVKINPLDFMMGNCGEVVGTTIRRTKIMEMGGFNDKYYPSADYHFWAMLSINSIVYKIKAPILGYYRIGESNESTKITTLKGFLVKDSQIMLGIAQYFNTSNWHVKLFRQFMLYSQIEYIRRWKRKFMLMKQNPELELIEKQIKVETRWYSFLIYSIIFIAYRGYCRYRDTFRTYSLLEI